MRKMTKEEFEKRCYLVHGNTYDISETEFTGSTNSITVKCSVHGNFNIQANKFYGGQGCYACVKEHSQDYKRLTTESFISKANNEHNNKYDYSKVVYGKNNTEKVIIVCKEHGEFLQSPDKHLQGRGCPRCKCNKISIARKVAPNGWSHSSWEAKGKESAFFEGFSLYIIRCTGNGEEFIKIGKTFTSIGRRFCSTEALPYKFSVILQVYYNAYAISRLEEKIHRELKEYTYVPKREFAGMYECYSTSVLEFAKELANK